MMIQDDISCPTIKLQQRILTKQILILDKIVVKYTFQNDTFRVVWSYHNRDPLSESALPQLQPLRSGSRPVHLYESAKSGFHRQQPGALKWLVASNSVVLPPKHTLYWCTMIKLPELPGKHQVREEFD